MILPYCKVMIGLAVHTPVPNAPLREMEVESRWVRVRVGVGVGV